MNRPAVTAVGHHDIEDIHVVDIRLGHRIVDWSMKGQNIHVAAVGYRSLVDCEHRIRVNFVVVPSSHQRMVVAREMMKVARREVVV